MEILKTKLMIAIIISLVFVGCGKDDDFKPTTNNAPFTFLKVGHEWKYGIYNNDTDSLIKDTIKPKIISQNDGYFKVTTDDDLYDDDFQYWFTNNEGWFSGWFSNDNTTSDLVMPLNCYVGLKYDSPNFYNCFAEIVSVSATVSVPAGTFNNCIKIKENPTPDIISYAYFHKDVGIIMSSANFTTLKLISKNF